MKVQACAAIVAIQEERNAEVKTIGLQSVLPAVDEPGYRAAFDDGQHDSTVHLALVSVERCPA